MKLLLVALEMGMVGIFFNKNEDSEWTNTVVFTMANNTIHIIYFLSTKVWFGCRLAYGFVIQHSWFHKRRLYDFKPPKQLCHEYQVIILVKKNT